MFTFLTAVNVLLLFVLTAMLILVVIQPRSMAQITFILFDIFVMIFVFGLQLELQYSDTVEAALSGLAVQYLGQCGFIVALLWFANEFIQMKLSRVVFFLQMLLCTLTMAGILTAGKNDLFYTSMTIVRTGMYTRISCENGILWYLHYAHFFIVFLWIVIFCLTKYHTLGPIHRKRIVYIMSGLGILLSELVMKWLGLFGSYNPVGIALTGTVLCMMMAVIKEGYFGSIDASMENVLNHGDEGLIVLDTWSRIIFANDKAYNLFPGLRVGYPVSSERELADALKKDGENVTINGSIWDTRVENIMENGASIGTTIYFIDVTALVQQTEELKAVNEERVRFMTKASHELRSPLNVVLGANEMILRETKEPSVREYAGLIREEIGGMVNLVEDIINSALAEQEMLAIKEEDFSMKDVFLHLNSVYKSKAGDKGLGFVLFWDGKSPESHEDLLVRGDRNRLMQILMNLLNNAVKYTDHGMVTLRAEEEEGADGQTAVTFYVQDTGSGIPESEQKNIFERFQRGRGAEQSGKEGLGLGLSIVKGFVEAMHGEIRLESEPGRGSNFIVTIPFLRAKAQTGTRTDTSASGSEAVPEDISFEGKRILAVDDRSRNILIMRRLLRKTNIVIDEANNGADAVKLCRENHYDAMIIDYMMPGMDGVQTLSAIRKDPEGQNGETYAVVFTANVTPEAEKMYKEAGFSDFLPKPVTYDEMVRALERAFAGSKAQDETAEESGDDGVIRRLMALGVDTDAGIAYSDDDREFYLELVRSFAATSGRDRQDLVEAANALQAGQRVLGSGLDSWKEFTRLAHGIKGELRSFGDEKDAEVYYSLEKAGKAEDLADLVKTLPGALERLEQFTRAVEGNQ